MNGVLELSGFWSRSDQETLAITATKWLGDQYRRGVSLRFVREVCADWERELSNRYGTGWLRISGFRVMEAT